MDILYIVVPCYNEQEVLPETVKRLKKKLSGLIDTGEISKNSKILFVDDGSKDDTWKLIERFHMENPLVIGLKLSRNKGHQNALLAGLMTAKDYADMIITLDADLQDDIEVIDEFVKKAKQGSEVIYGIRKSRKKDSFFKRFTAQSYYKLLKTMGVDIINDHAEYRLMSKRAVEALEQFKEANLFLRGIVPMIGFKTDTVYYERTQRYAGETKYPLSKMLQFALEGITSLSVKPIRFITFLGFLIFTVSIAMLIYILTVFFMGRTIQGWASVSVSVWAIGGLQLLSIGVIGEYIGKIYLETKQRPKYFIDKFLK